MTNKIFRSTVLVAVVVVLCSLAVVVGILYGRFSDALVQQLQDELSLAVTGTEQYGNAFLENVEADRFRITWVDTDGTVLFDTQADQTVMENHADREEIREALQTGSGSAVRASSTLTQQTVYEACRLQDGTVLRVSMRRDAAWYLVLGMLWPILLIVLLAIGLSALLARRMARKIMEPLNDLDLDHPLKNEVYDEVMPLLQRIHRQHNRIAQHMEALRRKSDEFEQLIGHMQEGFVLLSNEGTILSINPTAMRVFDTGDDCVGKNILMIDRSSQMRDAVNDALDKGNGCAEAERNGRHYRFALSRIQSDGQVIGAVLLAFDDTESHRAEQMRREFSANVSHELKTPLQGIIGSAELMENGLVKPADAPRFVGHIRREATRLVNLVEDILRLSQLDEGVALPVETVDLLALAESVQASLAAVAAEKNVTIGVSGAGFSVEGVRHLLQEMLYNLCENAVKYNVPGGQVWVKVENRAILVQDTGIGIPTEHQSRVFERFYRVDKSHSKNTGGTGLGLSIVKHAAAYHNAEITLESQPGKGTAITIIF